MTIIEVGRAETGELSPRQRWSHYFAILYGLSMIIIGINLRDSVLYATIPYENARAGIRGFYPQNWLLDTQGDYVFRVRDMAQPDFKTTIQVQIIPVSAASTARNLLDSLALTRAQIYAAYRQFPPRELILPDETIASAVDYSFVYIEPAPFLETLPVVVAGQDVIILQRGQAVVVSFQVSAERYDQTYPIFQTFLADLEF
ncbi:MAG: hypothetical protein SF162_04660 [bacterium]|nr:hypothetical protein [bacterium]